MSGSIKYNKHLRILLTWFILLIIIPQTYAANKWYVNDNSTTGDVFCSAVGNNGNTGSAASPYLTVAFVISNKVLAFGDTVFVDTGDYTDQWMLNSNSDGGNATKDLVFYGAGITKSKIVIAGAGTPAVYIGDGTAGHTGNSYITFKNLYFENSSSGTNTVEVQTSPTNITMNTCSFTVVGASCFQAFKANYLTVTNCTMTTNKDGIRCNYCGNHTFSGNTITMSTKTGNNCGIFLEGLSSQGNSDNSVIKNNKIIGGTYGVDMQNQGTGNTWQNNFISGCDYGMWGDNSAESHNTNTFQFNSIYSVKDCFRGDFNGWTIRNNIFYTTSSNTGEYCFFLNTASNDPTTLNYNIYYHPNGAKAAYRNGLAYTALVANWRNVFNSNEANGIEGDPSYTNAATGDLSIPSGSIAVNAAFAVATVIDDVRTYYVRPTTNQDIGAYENGAPLPVELLFLKATPLENGNFIEWATGSETNNNYFTVESSIDGFNFFPVEDVKGAGNSSQVLNYSFMDRHPVTLYYRIKQTDYDGKYTYSQTVIAWHKKQTEKTPLFVFPNPLAGDSFFMHIESDYTSETSIEITDALGQIVYQNKILLNSQNKALTEINLPNLTPGCYVVYFKKPTEIISCKLVKL